MRLWVCRRDNRYFMIDHGFVKSLGKSPDLDLRRGMSSDRACSYCKKIDKRLEVEFAKQPHLLKIMKDMVWAIPKMHIQGHCEECQYYFHLLYILGAGRVCGEGVERPWAETKLFAALCRDATKGHYHDLLNDGHNHWNFTRLVGLGASESLGFVQLSEDSRSKAFGKEGEGGRHARETHSGGPCGLLFAYQ